MIDDDMTNNKPFIATLHVALVVELAVRVHNILISYNYHLYYSISTHDLQ